MDLKWEKWKRSWVGISGQFRAEVHPPLGPLPLWYWTARAGDKQGNSGGTSSVKTAKKAAEIECNRLATALRR